MRTILFKTENKIEHLSEITYKRNKSDRALWIIIFTLLLLGTLMVASASVPYASSHYNDGAYYIKRQVVFLCIGIAIMMEFAFFCL